MFYSDIQKSSMQMRLKHCNFAITTTFFCDCWLNLISIGFKTVFIQCMRLTIHFIPRKIACNFDWYRFIVCIIRIYCELCSLSKLSLSNVATISRDEVKLWSIVWLLNRFCEFPINNGKNVSNKECGVT